MRVMEKLFFAVLWAILLAFGTIVLLTFVWIIVWLARGIA